MPKPAVPLYQEIIKELKAEMDGSTIYGVGNIHGAAEPLIEELKTMKIRQLVS